MTLLTMSQLPAHLLPQTHAQKVPAFGVQYSVIAVFKVSQHVLCGPVGHGSYAGVPEVGCYKLKEKEILNV